MTTLDPEIFDDLFQGCAFAAFIEEAEKANGPPCPERTRRRAYRLFEDALAERQGRDILAAPARP